MNHPSLDYTKDRGQDLRNYSDVTAGVKQDLFGEILEYYPGDYTRAGTSIEANTNGLYNGQIYGSRYKTRNDVNGTITGADYINYPSGPQLVTTTNYVQQELANRYAYDNFGQLASSTFGTFNNATNTFTGRTDYKEFGVTNNSIGYDENGNITRLQRNSYNAGGSPQLLDDLTYTYMTNTNKHLRVADAASNSFASTFNYKNQTAGSPINFLYDGNGRLAASMDENISAITYYPNGQIKQTTFANGNRTSYFYDDMGQKYKTTYYNAATTATKYTWYIADAVYEYVSSVGSFNLKELSIGGFGRVGVYKQDVAGVAIATGHAEYQLTDHLGNVRVTFRQGTGTNLDVLSKADYYAFGGQMPGRLWQQGGGDYRYGYQGQEKTQDDGTWDQFELRTLNHDLGRWTSPDPYGQFNNPYVSMGNNPISMIDPDGGYSYVGNNYMAFSQFQRLSGRVNMSIGPRGFVPASEQGIITQDLTLWGDGPETGGSSGGGSLFGGNEFNGGISFGQLDAMDGQTDGILTNSDGSSETAASFAQSIYNSHQSLYDKISKRYDAFVNTLGLSGNYDYNASMGTYGKWDTKFYFEYINPNKPVYANTNGGMAGGLSIVADSYFYQSWNSVGSNGSLLLSSASSYGESILPANAQSNGGGGLNTWDYISNAAGAASSYPTIASTWSYNSSGGDIRWTGKNGNYYVKSQVKMNGGYAKSIKYAQNASRNLSRIGNGLTILSLGTSVISAGIAVNNGTDNTSTWVGLGIGVGGAILTVVGSPVIVTAAAIGGAIWGISQLFYGDEINGSIDSNFGYR